MKSKFDILFEEVLTYLEKDGKLPHPETDDDAEGESLDQQEATDIINNPENSDIETECARN